MPTEAENKLAEENINLVYAFLTKRGMLHSDEDISAAMYGFAKAVKTFDPANTSKVRFSTYANVCMQNEIYTLHRSCDAAKRQAVVLSLSSPVSDNSLVLGDVVRGHADTAAECDSAILGAILPKLLEECRSTFTGEKQIQILNVWFESDFEASPTDIQRILSTSIAVSRPMVSTTISVFRARLKQILEEY